MNVGCVIRLASSVLIIGLCVGPSSMSGGRPCPTLPLTINRIDGFVYRTGCNSPGKSGYTVQAIWVFQSGSCRLGQAYNDRCSNQ